MKIDASAIFSIPVSRDPVDVKADSGTRDSDAGQPAGTPVAIPEVHKEDLNRVVEQMNKTMKIFDHALQFRVSDTGRVIITVLDAQSGEIIRQIPPEALVEAFDHVDKVLGLLVDRKV